MIRPLIGMAVLFSILVVAAPLQAQVVDLPLPAPDWELTPSKVEAGQDFALTALSNRYGCAHEFANHSVVVNDGRIDLSFTSTINPAVLCAAIVKPYGPTFKMAALKEGRYAVYMNLLLPCHVQEKMCRAAIPVEYAGVLTVSGEGKIAYVISPAEVEAEKAFALKLLSPDFGCNIDYLLTASRVQDGKITLTFLDKPNPLVRCAPLEKMYGPEYQLPGLKAGTYEVWAERLPACAEQGCKMLPIPEPVGKLSVKSVAARKGWFLKPREVKAGAPFALNVVNNEYGNCNTSFDHTSLVVQDNAIKVSFVIVNNPDHVCVMDLRPHGPAFNVSALKTGLYPVYVNVLPGCIFSEPRCLIMPPEFPTVASDTLVVVSQTLGLGGKAGAGFRREPMAFWQGGALKLTLPEGAQGLWRAEVMSLSGRLLHSDLVIAGSDRGALLTGMRGVERGLVLVRLVSPDRISHLLRVPVQ
jgi:hypothetical protein